MADVPHYHADGIDAVKVFLVVVALFGALHLVAAHAPHNKLSQAWVALGF